MARAIIHSTLGSIPSVLDMTPVVTGRGGVPVLAGLGVVSARGHIRRVVASVPWRRERSGAGVRQRRVVAVPWIGAQAETTVTTVCPILILSPLRRRCAAWIRRPFSQVPLVDPRSLTYQLPCAIWNRACWLDA
jgi:hypothetical protein